MHITPPAAPQRNPYNAPQSNSECKRIDMTGIFSPEEEAFFNQHKDDEGIRSLALAIGMMRYCNREAGLDAPGELTVNSLEALREHFGGAPAALRGLARMAAMMEQGKLRLTPPVWIARQARRDSGIDTRA